MSLNDEGRLLSSPLHQLEMQTAKARSRSNSASPIKGPASPDAVLNIDRDSVYSFDSVSTNGRLLDRLGIESEDLFDDDTQQTQHRFEKLILNNESRSGKLQSPFMRPEVSLAYAGVRGLTTQKPETAVDRLAVYRSQSILRLKPNIVRAENQPFQESKFTVKSVPSKVPFPNRNKSIDSFKADITTSSSRASSVRKVPNTALDAAIFSNNSDDERDDRPPQDYDDFVFTGYNEHPKVPLRTPSAPTIASSGRDLDSSPRSRRTVSDKFHSPSGKTADLTPEARTQLASQLRNLGKHREASYQLQIAANPPHNFPKAMYLYAMALRYGQGVKQNDQQALRWLCKCVISSSKGVDEGFLSNLQESKLEDLLSISFQILDNDTNETDPNKLYDFYKDLPANQLHKITSAWKTAPNTFALAYHEFGNSLINGWGCPQKDEAQGIKALSCAASMGNINSMVQLGEILSTKTKTRKKDNYKASAWFRLSEIFGIKSIGNSWIYKEKYLEKR